MITKLVLKAVGFAGIVGATIFSLAPDNSHAISFSKNTRCSCSLIGRQADASGTTVQGGGSHRQTANKVTCTGIKKKSPLPKNGNVWDVCEWR